MRENTNIFWLNPSYSNLLLSFSYLIEISHHLTLNKLCYIKISSKEHERKKKTSEMQLTMSFLVFVLG